MKPEMGRGRKAMAHLLGTLEAPRTLTCIEEGDGSDRIPASLVGLISAHLGKLFAPQACGRRAEFSTEP